MVDISMIYSIRKVNTTVNARVTQYHLVDSWFCSLTNMISASNTIVQIKRIDIYMFIWYHIYIYEYISRQYHLIKINWGYRNDVATASICKIWIPMDESNPIRFSCGGTIGNRNENRTKMSLAKYMSGYRGQESHYIMRVSLDVTVPLQ